MGWAARSNPTAQDAKAGLIQPWPKPAREPKPKAAAQPMNLKPGKYRMVHGQMKRVGKLSNKVQVTRIADDPLSPVGEALQALVGVEQTI